MLQGTVPEDTALQYLKKNNSRYTFEAYVLKTLSKSCIINFCKHYEMAGSWIPESSYVIA